jgi:hypothetical protein
MQISHTSYFPDRSKLTHLGEKFTIRASKLATHSEKRATTGSGVLSSCHLPRISKACSSLITEHSPLPLTAVKRSPQENEGQDPFHRRASRTILNAVSAARRTRVNPAAFKISAKRPSPAWAPSPNPTSCERDAGVQSSVDAP